MYNWYYYVSLIYYFSFKYEIGGMRVVYWEMVEWGEIVDMVVLNVMMLGLLRVGEEMVVDRIYERMKVVNFDLGEVLVKGGVMMERVIM